jgi:hypothetical protein
VWGVSLAISVAIHAAVVLYYGLFSQGFLIPAAGVTSLSSEASPIQGTRIIRLQVQEESQARPSDPVTTAPPVEPEEQEPARQAEPRALVGLPEPGEAEVVEVEPSGITNADRLRTPEEGDSLIWAFVDPDRGALTDAERYQLSLWWRLAAWYDSLGAIEEAQRRALDWTFTDDSGGKWGVSPGRIHLGSITLPLPDFFSIPPTQRETVGRRIEEWEEINAAARTNAVWDSWKDRARAIRERKDRERADTTRSGGSGA